MDFQTLTLELEKRASDLAQLKRPASRYAEMLNWAISQYPMLLWPLTIDGSTLDTVEGQQEYALSGISSLTTPAQVVRVWVDDSEGVKRETGRYEIWDNAGSLTLFLDESPSGAYDITLEFRKAPATLSSPTDTTEADDEWLLARAMLSLISEAAWEAENPQQLLTQAEYLTQLVVQRERTLLYQRTHRSRRARTNAWRNYVT